MRGVTTDGINRYLWSLTPWAGLTCDGDATLVLEGSNYVKTYHQEYSAIYVPEGHTLTIRGTGQLTADGNDSWAASIGGCRNISCGNIVIEGGTIEARSGINSAGIGGGENSNCGDITIKSTVTKITSIRVNDTRYSIGAGLNGRCGKVTIGVDVGSRSEKQYTYEPQIVYLSQVTSAYTARSGVTLTGKLGGQHKISIPHGATVTLKDITIEGKDWKSTPWAGLTCQGDATLIIEGTNYVQSVHPNYSAIYVPSGKTLTIKGSGELTADAKNSYSAGIGGGYGISCGNIVIEGGTIIANGGELEAGNGAGIGGGGYSNCGDITIKDTVTQVRATKGEDAQHSIGAGQEGSCGTVTLGDKEGAIERSPCTYKETIDLSKITSSYTAQHGNTLTDTLKENIRISVADGATVTLRDITIKNNIWAMLNCEGDATLILEGTNYIKTSQSSYPAIYVPAGKTLTIKGSGALTADASFWSHSAGIGAGECGSCGNIVIEGGTIEAKGGMWAAGIGGGYSNFDTINCGNITIKDTITKVIASGGTRSIGAGLTGSCGTVTIGGVVTGSIPPSTFTYNGTINLSNVTSDYTAKHCETITGKLNADAKISVANGATITLRDVNIKGKNWPTTQWAGLTCEGDATLILDGSNYVQRVFLLYPAIYVPEGHTLTIKGSGQLTADAAGSSSAGIGGGDWESCGNIVIEGGTIEAIGGISSAGIGGGRSSNCGDITIKDTVTKVTATKGWGAQHSIGAGEASSCGKVKLPDQDGPSSADQYIYPRDKQ